VIVVSSASGGYRQKQAMDAGADLFATKPIGIDELIEVFREAVDHMRK
jgi:CheY-like chemotaxis protein